MERKPPEKRSEINGPLGFILRAAAVLVDDAVQGGATLGLELGWLRSLC
jgi:hypothetical protein